MYINGTVVYWSPELKTKELGNSTKSDIWALGCILYEMCTGQWLREGYIDAARQGSPERLIRYTPDLRSVIQDCWRLIPKARPSIARLKDSSTMRLIQIVVAGRDKDLTESRKLCDQEIAQCRLKIDEELKQRLSQLQALWESEAAKTIDREVKRKYQGMVAGLESKHKKRVESEVDHMLRKLLQQINSPAMAQPSSADTSDQTEQVRKLLAAFSVKFHGQMSAKFIDWQIRLARLS